MQVTIPNTMYSTSMLMLTHSASKQDSSYCQAEFSTLWSLDCYTASLRPHSQIPDTQSPIAHHSTHSY